MWQTKFIETTSVTTDNRYHYITCHSCLSGHWIIMTKRREVQEVLRFTNRWLKSIVCKAIISSMVFLAQPKSIRARVIRGGSTGVPQQAGNLTVTGSQGFNLWSLGYSNTAIDNIFIDTYKFINFTVSPLHNGSWCSSVKNNQCKPSVTKASYLYHQKYK